MRRLRFYMIFVWIAIASASCTEMIVLDKGDVSHNINKITINVAESSSTSEYETRNSIKYTGTWASKPGLKNWFYKEDTLGIFPQTGDQIPFPLTDVTTEDTKFEFHGTGWELVDTLTYYAYFPFSRKNYKDAQNINHIEVNFFGQKQDPATAITNNNVDFVRDDQCPYLYMFSTPTKADVNGDLNFKLEYLSSSIRFLAMVPCAGTTVVPANSRIILVKIVADQPIFTLEGTYDLDSMAQEKQNLIDAGYNITNGSIYDPMYIKPSKRGKTNVLSLSYDNLAPTVASTNLMFYGHILLPKTEFDCPFSVNIYDSELNWWQKKYSAGGITGVYGGNTTYLNVTGMSYMGKAMPSDVRVEPWDETEEEVNVNWNYK